MKTKILILIRKLWIPLRFKVGDMFLYQGTKYIVEERTRGHFGYEYISSLEHDEECQLFHLNSFNVDLRATKIINN